MIDKKSRRVVIINNIPSDAIDQAIFILKDRSEGSNKAFSEKDIVHEAQNIIDRYTRQVERLKETKTSSKTQKKAVSSTLLTVAVTAAFMLAVFFTVVYTM